jgi:hypothetical protein
MVGRLGKEDMGLQGLRSGCGGGGLRTVGGLGGGGISAVPTGLGSTVGGTQDFVLGH